MNDFTLIVTSRNRPDKLDRCLSYYSKKKINLIVLDGSEKEFLEIGKYPDIDYRFMPGKNRVYRFVAALKSVKTKYVMHLADDDFVITDSIAPCIKFLEENNEYVFCSGGFEHRFAIIGRALYHNLDTIIDYNDSHEDSVVRIQKLNLTPYYGVYRTKTLSQFYNILKELPSEVFDSKAWNGYIMIALCSIIPALGKLKQLNFPFLLRENEYGDKSISIPNAMLPCDITENFISLLSKKIISFFIKENIINDDEVNRVRIMIAELYAGDILIQAKNFNNPQNTSVKRMLVKKYFPSSEVILHNNFRKYQIIKENFRVLKSMRLINGFVQLRKSSEAKEILAHIKNHSYD